MIVLPNRKCGKVKSGGLYAIGRKGVFGTLLPFTAIAAPLPAEVANPRKPQVVDTARTLTGLAGLVNYDEAAIIGRFARLPKIGLADYWGQSQGYRNVWDVVEETQRFGICRRVANVPSVPLPCPVLVLHAEAVMSVPPSRSGVTIKSWLDGYGIRWDFQGVQALREYVEDVQPLLVSVDDQPWREAHSLGRKGDDDFMWHPYTDLWRIIPELKRHQLFKRFRQECSARFEQGVFGISWLTDFCYVLKDDETEVPAHLAERGVVGAFAQDDLRAKEVV